MLIHFDKIKISDDNKYLELDIRVGEESYYKEVLIRKVKIQDKNTYGERQYNWQTETVTKNFSKKIPLTEILTGIKNNILFISVEISGAPTADCPCNNDILPIAVYADTSTIINNIKADADKLVDSCSAPKGFMNYLLLYKAFEYSIKTCHYEEAIRYFEQLLKEYKSSITSNCGCNG